jgi:hypothetical protein
MHNEAKGQLYLLPPNNCELKLREGKVVVTSVIEDGRVRASGMS